MQKIEYMDWIVRFDRNDRSTFPYWFAHWCAFNMTALNLKKWKFKYLFHDFEKPWLKLFMSYKKVQQFHNLHNKHHLLHYFIKESADWEAMVIDWECGRFTKQQCPRNAVDEYYRIFEEFKNWILNDVEADNKTINYFNSHNINKKDKIALFINAYNQLYHTFEDRFGMKVDKYDEHYLTK